MQAPKKLFLCLMIVAQMCRPNSVAQLKNTVTLSLAQHCPTALSKFHELCSDYDTLVLSFFDKHDNQSLAAHIQRMRPKVALLKQLAQDPDFASVNTIINSFTMQVQELIATLTHYIGSKNVIGLAWHVQKFRPLLPHPLCCKSDFSLFGSLCHRLHC